jgi:23S rRNA (pseudouridine1915-N3)-methyltransferase
MRDEGERMLKAIPRGCRVLALDVRGKEWSTEQLTGKLDEWMAGGRDIALLVGGPEGLAESCLQRADGRWSLSPLTMPHPLVRVVLADQLYRAWSIMRNHPYHRA